MQTKHQDFPKKNSCYLVLFIFMIIHAMYLSESWHLAVGDTWGKASSMLDLPASVAPLGDEAISLTAGPQLCKNEMMCHMWPLHSRSHLSFCALPYFTPFLFSFNMIRIADILTQHCPSPRSSSCFQGSPREEAHFKEQPSACHAFRLTSNFSLKNYMHPKLFNDCLCLQYLLKLAQSR